MLVQAQRRYTIKSEPSWRLCSLGVYDVSWTTLLGDADKAGGRVCVRLGGTWGLLVPLSQFCCETETALKNKKKKKRMRVLESLHQSLIPLEVGPKAETLLCQQRSV